MAVAGRGAAAASSFARKLSAHPKLDRALETVSINLNRAPKKLLFFY